MAEPLVGAAPLFEPKPDGRPMVVVPPPVRLLTITDLTLATLGGREKWLDMFYVRVLGFEAVESAEAGRKPKFGETLYRAGAGGAGGSGGAKVGGDGRERLPGKRLEDAPVVPGPRWYRAENFVLHYEVVEKITPEQLKLVQVEVPSLEGVAKKLMELQVEYERFRGLMPGLVYLQLSDPTGHVIQVFEGGRFPL